MSTIDNDCKNARGILEALVELKVSARLNKRFNVIVLVMCLIMMMSYIFAKPHLTGEIVLLCNIVFAIISLKLTTHNNPNQFFVHSLTYSSSLVLLLINIVMSLDYIMDGEIFTDTTFALYVLVAVICGITYYFVLKMKLHMGYKSRRMKLESGTICALGGFGGVLGTSFRESGLEDYIILIGLSLCFIIQGIIVSKNIFAIMLVKRYNLSDYAEGIIEKFLEE